MNIFVVGNVLKDVYLNLDSRNEHFETDKNNTKWLDLSFDASSHHYFNRNSSFGGAAISLEVFRKLNIPAQISNSDFHLSDDGPQKETPSDSYRYIMILDDDVSYFTPSQYKETIFAPPSEPADYLYIDRSTVLSENSIQKISSYLDQNPNTKLILYLKNENNLPIKNLIDRASIIFAEYNSPSFDFEKTVYLSDKDLTFKNITEPINVNRIDKLTHLSAFSIAAATVLGSFILGKSIEDTLKLARINVENSNLDSVLSLSELESLINTPSENLELIAANLMLKDKGILAADESGGSIKKKFAALDIPDTFENRHDYRNIFFTTPDIEKYVNGIILFDETARDFADNGQTYVDFLTSKCIMPGIKVDQGLEKFPDSEETFTKGLADLPKRLREYHEIGLRFAKWRAAFNITLSENGEILTPTERAIAENCQILAEYARDCQSAGIVPIVEPEVVYDGYYSIEQNTKITSKILDELFKKLSSFNVNLRACILKTNMILAGKQLEKQSTPDDVGVATAKVLKEHVPSETAGIVFLSGGQTVEQATDNLSEIIKNGPFPWPVSFSFARALQDPALYCWHGDNSKIPEARQAFLNRLIANSNALKK